MYHVGIDYHKSYSTLCVLNDAGEKVLERTVRPNLPERFSAVFDELDQPAQAVFECGLNYGYLYDLLEALPQMKRVVVANAGRTKIIAEAQIKTDKIDAYKLAWLLRADLIPEVHVPCRATRARREPIRARAYWVRQRTRLRNRVHRILERNTGKVELPQVKNLFGKSGKAALRKARLPEPDATLLRQHLEAMDQVNARVNECAAIMERDGETCEDLKLLCSIPGIGPVLGSVLAAEIDGIDRFLSASRFVAYCGLVPTTHSSGGKTRHGRMLPGCNKWLKWAFIEAAWVAVGCSATFGSLYRYHRQRGKKANTAITIVARRMAKIVWHLLQERRIFEERTPLSPGRLELGLTEPSRLA